VTQTHRGSEGGFSTFAKNEHLIFWHSRQREANQTNVALREKKRKRIKLHQAEPKTGASSVAAGGKTSNP